MEDHHVDRPEVQAQQCAQLTGTNRPIGLIRSGKGMASRHPNPDRILPNVSQKPGHTDVALNPVPGSSSGLVAMARAKHPIPSRTRKLSAAAPMVLRQKTRESRSPPDLTTTPTPAGWSSPVARQAHNLKAAGSNPAPATKNTSLIKDFKAEHNARLLSFQILVNTWSTFFEPPYAVADNRGHDRHSTNS